MDLVGDAPSNPNCSVMHEKMLEGFRDSSVKKLMVSVEEDRPSSRTVLHLSTNQKKESPTLIFYSKTSTYRSL